MKLKVKELIIDSFAGGGGASLGIKWATGRCPDIAINHNLAAIKMHEANHPDTLHLHEDVWSADLEEIIAGRPVGLLWASPDCTHFSRAKGDTPVKNEIRGLAQVITKWARQFKPRVIILENVREFTTWGPLCPKWTCRSCRWKGVEGQTILKRVRRRCPRCDSLRVSQVEGLFPDPEKRGLLFNRWVSRLKSFGYDVEYKELNGADYGAPTNRKRLFVVARCDGYEINWPKPTHASPAKLVAGQQRHRTAAECIDWDIPCPSIFDRDPPLVEKTMRRIAMGTKRYVLDAAEPFLVVVNHGGDHFRGGSLLNPAPTVTKSHSAGVVVPQVAPLIMDVEHGSDLWRGRGVDVPMSTIMAQPKGGKHALVAAFMAQHNGGMVGNPADKPLATITQRGTQSQIVTAFMARHFGNSVGQSLEQPAPTELNIPHSYLVAGSLVQTGYGEREGQAPRALDINKPLGTVVAGGTKAGLVAANLVHANHGDKQWSSLEDPMRTITSANHAYLVSAFLLKWYGTGIQKNVLSPMDTITKKDRFSLIVVYISGVPFIIYDIGMRMLQPHELALAQGFPRDYILLGSKVNKVARIGNSVVPQVAEAVVRANLCTKLKKRKVEDVRGRRVPARGMAKGRRSSRLVKN